MLLTWLTFANTLDSGFVWDDHELVARNSDVRSGSLEKLFTSGAWAFQAPGQLSANNNYYRPLQILSYRIVDSLAGLSPFPFHVASLVLHALTTLLAYAVFYKLIGSVTPAFVGACLFALHPIHTEAIDWIACSTDLGCALFFLLSFYSYLRGRMLWWGVSLASFLAALLWKEMAATLPILIALYILNIEKGGFRKAVASTLPYWAVFAIYLMLRHNALGVFYASNSTWHLSAIQFAGTLVTLIAGYWWALLLPIQLNAYHVFDTAATFGLGQIVLLGGISALLVYGYKRYPLAAFAGLWVFVALLPVLNVYHLGSNVFGERYLYLPSIGFCLLLALIIDRLPRQALLCVAALLAFYIYQDVNRANDWKDDFTLFTKTLQSSPNSALAHNMMGGLYRTEKNDPVEAENQYQQAIRFAQDSHPPQISQLSLAYVGLSQVYDETHQPIKALDSLEQAQRVNPSGQGVKLARAVILAETGDWQKSKPILERLLNTDPYNDVALNTLGLIAWEDEHDTARATDLFERALKVGGTDVTMASIHNNLGAISGEQRNYEIAISHFEKAAELDPANPQYPTMVGNVYGMQGRRDEAKAWFQRALEINPQYPPAQEGLSRLR